MYGHFSAFGDICFIIRMSSYSKQTLLFLLHEARKPGKAQHQTDKSGLFFSINFPI